MSLITKRGLSIILITLIVLALSGVYILKSGSQKFAILDTDKVNSINDPTLKIAIEATDECNKIETIHKNETEPYRNNCYLGIAWPMGKYYGTAACEKLKDIFKSGCYSGYGRSVGEKYSPDIKTIQDECSKTEFYETCLVDAALTIGKESSKHIETEQCQEFEQENAKQKCYEGIGRKLAEDNKEKNLCENVKDKESCLQGYSFTTDQKGNREEALQICEQLNEYYAKRCYSQIGVDSIYIYNKTIKESFKDCEQYSYQEYSYQENCKNGVARGVAYKFFEENQQKKEETASVTTPAILSIYEIINPSATKISLSIKQQIIPHFINYKLIYLIIILSASEIIIIIRVLKNKKVQKAIKKVYEEIRIITQKVYSISTKTVLHFYKGIKRILQDILIIDKTTINSVFKELKIELRNKEGKKKL